MIEYYTLAIIALLAVISPGPDFVVVAKNAMAHDFKRALMTSFGVTVGVVIHSTYCVLGLAIIISQSILLFSLIKYLGASYLIYLGVKSLISKSENLHNEADTKTITQSNWKAFRDGLLTNVLNPKCTLFILSVFTLMVKPHTLMIVQASYGIEIALITFAWFAFLSYSLASDFIKSKLEKVQHVISKVIGGILITLGVAVFFKSR